MIGRPMQRDRTTETPVERRPSWRDLFGWTGPATARWPSGRPHDDPAFDAALTEFRRQIELGYIGTMPDGPGKATHVRELPRDAERGHAPPDRRRLGVEAGQALPELASVPWRRPTDAAWLRRYGRIWQAWTVAYTVPFVVAGAVLLALDPVTVPVALVAFAHGWVIPELYAFRGASVVRPKGPRNEEGEAGGPGTPGGPAGPRRSAISIAAPASRSSRVRSVRGWWGRPARCW